LNRCVSFDWFQRFKKAESPIKMTKIQGHFQYHKLNQIVREKLRNYRWLTIKEVVNGVGILLGSCYLNLVVKLDMKRVLQTENRIKICFGLKNRVSIGSNFLKSIITSN